MINQIDAIKAKGAKMDIEIERDLDEEAYNAYLMRAEEDETTHCYLCYLEQTGHADYSEKADQGPLRRVLRHSLTNQRQDPTDALHLDCGHVII